MIQTFLSPVDAKDLKLWNSEKITGQFCMYLKLLELVIIAVTVTLSSKYYLAWLKMRNSFESPP